MISLIIKSYFILLLSIGLGSLFIFTFGLYFIFRKSSPRSNAVTASPELSALTCDASPPHHDDGLEDLSAIAGEDVLVTQLDLARAYIETDKKSLAKQILESVMAQGTHVQQEEAQRLLNTL